MVFSRFFGASQSAASAGRIYAAIVAQARRPEFYTSLHVPDTLDGRFELIALHAYLILNRLKGQGVEAEAVAQAVFDAMFDDMDRNLREMGVGDLGVGRRVKAMAQGFYGRIAAYDRGLALGDVALGEAIARNLYGTVGAAHGTVGGPEIAIMTAYLRASHASLARCSIEEITANGPLFPDPPGSVASSR